MLPQTSRPANANQVQHALPTRGPRPSPSTGHAARATPKGMTPSGGHHATVPGPWGDLSAGLPESSFNRASEKDKAMCHRADLGEGLVGSGYRSEIFCTSG